LRIDAHHSFSERYPLDHLGSILARNRFEGSILVEEAFAQDLELPDFVRGVVLPFDLHALDQYQLHPRFRGVWWHFRDRVPEGFDELQRRAIPLDILEGLPWVPRLADRFPALRIAIDHLGAPPGDDWARDLERAAVYPQVCCKVSGLARLPDSPRRYVQHALAVFGPRRLMFGSDWPASLPDVTWKASLAAFTQAIGAQAIEVREDLLGGSAERFYAL
jgi:L-fuconolactonase